MPQEPNSPDGDAESRSNNLVVPDTSIGDAAVAAFQFAAGSIPVIGTPLGAIVDYQWRMYVSEKWTEFGNGVVRNLERLGKKVDDLDTSFYAMLTHATWLATLTNEPEKLEAFKNIILNTAQPNPPDAEMREMFLSMVAVLTGRHIRLLDFLFHPWKYDVGADPQHLQMVSPGLSGVLLLIARKVPGLERPDILERCISDLESQGLVTYREEGRDARMLDSPHTTNLAKEFMAFITAPEMKSQADPPEKQND